MYYIELFSTFVSAYDLSTSFIIVIS